MTLPLPEEIERTRARMTNAEKIEMLRKALEGLAKAYASLDGAVTMPGTWHSHAMATLAATEKE